jgi:hypothetical protein
MALAVLLHAAASPRPRRYCQAIHDEKFLSAVAGFARDGTIILPSRGDRFVVIVVLPLPPQWQTSLRCGTLVTIPAHPWAVAACTTKANSATGTTRADERGKRCCSPSVRPNYTAAAAAVGVATPGLGAIVLCDKSSSSCPNKALETDPHIALWGCHLSCTCNKTLGTQCTQSEANRALAAAWPAVGQSWHFPSCLSCEFQGRRPRPWLAPSDR